MTVRRPIGRFLIPASMIALACALGSCSVINLETAANPPPVSATAPLPPTTQLDEFDYAGATAIATAMLLLSFAVLLLVNTLQARLSRGGSRGGH